MTLKVFGAIVLLFVSTRWMLAQTASNSAGVPVSMVVTVETHKGSAIPEIGRENVMVYQGRIRARVTDWVPIQGGHASPELIVLIDDSPNVSQGTQPEDIASFIMAQPETTKIGVAYMQMGSPQLAQAPTTDHALAAKAVHPTLSSLEASVSPYFSLSELMKRWPSSNGGREVLMISDGIDGSWDGPPENDVYVDATIEEAQRAGVVVFTVGRKAGSWQYSLSKTADETGGRAYWQESGTPLSVAPYLKDVAQCLRRQYLLTFLAQPKKTAGMQAVKLMTEVPNAKLVGADKVYVSAAAQ